MIHGHVFVQAFLLVCSIITFVANISFVTLVVFSSEKNTMYFLMFFFTKIELNTECLVSVVDLDRFKELCLMSGKVRFES